MARRQKKSRPQADAVVETAGAVQPAPAGPIPSHRRLMLAVAVAVVWIAGLAVLASATANRPMLNRAQIRQADLIVTGRIVDRDEGAVSIEKTWKPAGSNQQAENRRITVRNLSESKAAGERTWLLPLTHVAGDVFEITRPKLKRPQATDAELERPPRIYPASGVSVEQLRKILDEPGAG